MENLKKVCIVGGGASGLAALRHVMESPTLTGTLFEQKCDVGGLWNYSGEKVFATSPENLTPDLPLDKNPECVTTMYDNLTGNLPHPLMQLGDFSHKKLTPLDKTFPTQPDMLEYFRGYATHFKLWPNIQLNTAVVRISPEDSKAPEGEPVRWIVKTHNHLLDKLNTELFDAVIICTGKNQYPHNPQIPGLDTFQGKVMHYKYFKNARQFSGENVVCIGLGPSSADFAINLSKFSKTITVCHKFPGGYKLGLLPRNVRETQNVQKILADRVVTETGEEIKCDTIILCTGYDLKFPFLEKGLLEVVEGKYVRNLWKMTVYTKRPNLAVMNMVYRCAELVLVEVQIRWFVKVLEGGVKLPGVGEMEEEIWREEEKKRGKGVGYSEWFQVGNFGMESWGWFGELAREGDMGEEYEGRFKMWEWLYNFTVGRLFGKLLLHRRDRLEVIEEGKKWRVTLGGLEKGEEFREEDVGKGGEIRVELNEENQLVVEDLTK